MPHAPSGSNRNWRSMVNGIEPAEDRVYWELLWLRCWTSSSSSSFSFFLCGVFAAQGLVFSRVSKPFYRYLIKFLGWRIGLSQGLSVQDNTDTEWSTGNRIHDVSAQGVEDITRPYNPVKVNRRFGGTCRYIETTALLVSCFLLVPCLAYSSILKMEALFLRDICWLSPNYKA
jgi:hypothetical protein